MDNDNTAHISDKKYGKKLNILYVEDNPDHAEIVMQNFRHYKFPNKLFHVSDGQEALDFLFHKGKFTDLPEDMLPDVVLLDLRLPKIDGIEVLREIRASETLRSLPVVILTSSELERDMAGAHRYQANCYLVKPIDLTKFKQMLHAVSFYSMGQDDAILEE